MEKSCTNVFKGQLACCLFALEKSDFSWIFQLVNMEKRGCAEWKGKLDMFNVIMIGLSKELPEQDEQYELHRLLGLLFGSHGLTNEQKLNMI